jgi:hypothetical protein
VILIVDVIYLKCLYLININYQSNKWSFSLLGVVGGVLIQSLSQQVDSQCLNFNFSKKVNNNVNDEIIKFIVNISIFFKF